jgi:hypothetical protein
MPRDVGWIPDATGVKKPRHRYDAPGADRAAPAHAHVPAWRWTVYDPADLQACAASAIGAAIQLSQHDRPAAERVRPSIPFIYFAARYLQLQETTDSGTSIYHALRACFSFGFCSDAEWPLDSIRDASERPSPEAEVSARDNGLVEFRHIAPDLRSLQACIYSDQRPFIFGAFVDDDFLDGRFDNEADVRIPRGTALDNPHRHCLLAVGYEDVKDHASGGGYFWVRDSLGPGRGSGGYLRLPYRYLVPPPGQPRLANDFWVITGASVGADAQRDALRQKRAAYWSEAPAFAGLVDDTYQRVTNRKPEGGAPLQFPPLLSGG